VTRTGLVRLATLLCFAAVPAAGDEPDLAGIISARGADPASSTLLIVRLSDRATWASNPERAERRFPPASTSKIAHTLIAIETGYALPDSAFEWDGTARFVDAWNRDQTLASAFSVSAVWVYQRITSDLGHATMAEWIDRLDYGNETIGSAADLTTYWLQGPLAISAREQIDFLTRLANADLPLSAVTMAAAKPVMVADSGNGWVLYAKTGWQLVPDGTDLGWYVGWLQSTGASPDTWVFAFNLDMQLDEDVAKRRPIVHEALRQVGALPDQD
jgi:beta-lactamase class D